MTTLRRFGLLGSGAHVLTKVDYANGLFGAACKRSGRGDMDRRTNPDDILYVQFQQSPLTSENALGSMRAGRAFAKGPFPTLSLQMTTCNLH